MMKCNNNNKKKREERKTKKLTQKSDSLPGESKQMQKKRETKKNWEKKTKQTLNIKKNKIC